jgi:hypothetical protein
VCVDQRIDVDQRLENSVHRRLSLRTLLHPPDKSPLIAAIGEDEKIGVAGHRGQELLKDPVFLISVVSPERETLFLISLDDDQADEVVVSLIWGKSASAVTHQWLTVAPRYGIEIRLPGR